MLAAFFDLSKEYFFISSKKFLFLCRQHFGELLKKYGGFLSISCFFPGFAFKVSLRGFSKVSGKIGRVNWKQK